MFYLLHIRIIFILSIAFLYSITCIDSFLPLYLELGSLQLIYQMDYFYRTSNDISLAIGVTSRLIRFFNIGTISLEKFVSVEAVQFVRFVVMRFTKQKEARGVDAWRVHYGIKQVEEREKQIEISACNDHTRALFGIYRINDRYLHFRL